MCFVHFALFDPSRHVFWCSRLRTAYKINVCTVVWISIVNCTLTLSEQRANHVHIRITRRNPCLTNTRSGNCILHRIYATLARKCLYYLWTTLLNYRYMNIGLNMFVYQAIPYCAIISLITDRKHNGRVLTLLQNKH